MLPIAKTDFRSDWSRAASTKPALTPVNLEKWAVIFTKKDRSVVERFCKTMQQQAPKMGIQIRNPAIKEVENDRTDTFLKAISDVVVRTDNLSQVLGLAVHRLTHLGMCRA